MAVQNCVKVSCALPCTIKTLHEFDQQYVAARNITIAQAAAEQHK
jgi:hypothetical protein